MAATLHFKQIKPKRFKGSAAINVLTGAARKAGNEIKKDFEKTTATWSTKVQFNVVYRVKGGGPEVFVFTDSEIYGYVNDGTRPHLIFPVRAKALAFASGYTAKTSPGVIGSGAGGPSGSTVVRPYVEHPGTEARKFDQVIGEQWESKFKRRMEDAMRRAARATGHAL